MASLVKIHDLLPALPQIGLNKSESIVKTSIKNVQSLKKPLKSRVLCKSKSSQNTYGSHLSKKSSKINFADFWSGRMKAEIRNLENNNFNQRKIKKTLNKTPIINNELSKRFMRKNLESLNIKSTKVSSLGLVPTIDKIICDCELAIRTSRKLSIDIPLHNNILTRRFNTYSKTILS